MAENSEIPLSVAVIASKISKTRLDPSKERVGRKLGGRMKGQIPRANAAKVKATLDVPRTLISIPSVWDISLAQAKRRATAKEADSKDEDEGEKDVRSPRAKATIVNLQALGMENGNNIEGESDPYPIPVTKKPELPARPQSSRLKAHARQRHHVQMTDESAYAHAAIAARMNDEMVGLAEGMTLAVDDVNGHGSLMAARATSPAQRAILAQQPDFTSPQTRTNPALYGYSQMSENSVSITLPKLRPSSVDPDLVRRPTSAAAAAALAATKAALAGMIPAASASPKPAPSLDASPSPIAKAQSSHPQRVALHLDVLVPDLPLLEEPTPSSSPRAKMAQSVDIQLMSPEHDVRLNDDAESERARMWEESILAASTARNLGQRTVVTIDPTKRGMGRFSKPSRAQITGRDDTDIKLSSSSAMLSKNGKKPKKMLSSLPQVSQYDGLV